MACLDRGLGTVATSGDVDRCVLFDRVTVPVRTGASLNVDSDTVLPIVTAGVLKRSYITIAGFLKQNSSYDFIFFCLSGLSLSVIEISLILFSLREGS
jgi:hypothetical protein